jgi:probable addiction module antidote protein
MRKSKKIRAVAKGLNVSHRARLIEAARAAGVPRASLYWALSAGGNPRFSTLRAILKAAGLKMAAQRV